MPVTVADILHRAPPVTIREDATIAQLGRLLAEHRISGVPVLGADGRLAGVVSQRDIVRLIAGEVAMDEVPAFDFYSPGPGRLPDLRDLGRELRDRKVRDIMERRIHSVRPSDSIALAARMLRNLHIHRLLVVEDGIPVGVLSSLDLLRVLERPEFVATFYSST
jgi:CBS domain-containing protein